MSLSIAGVGCIWIMIAMGWFARRLWMALRHARRLDDEMLARFYRSLLWFAAVVPGVALFLIGALVAAPDSAPKARAIRAQLNELDRL